VVTNLWPTPERPAWGSFVRDQVDALRTIDGLDVEVLAFTPTGAVSYVRAARVLRRRFAPRGFDVVHAHYGLTGWSALGVRHARHVVTFHGTDLHHPLVGRLSRALATRLSLPAPVSGSLARSAVGLHGAGVTRRVAILPCGVDLERFRPLDRSECRRRLGLDPAGRYLLWPARPGRPEKRLPLARELADRLPGVELLTLGAVPGEDVPAWVNAANAVLVTSERESFGLAALEALACDVPVLSTDVGVAPVALRGIEGTLCEPFEVDRWLEAVRGHVEAEDPRVRGRARAAAFGKERMAERVAAAYADVLALA